MEGIVTRITGVACEVDARGETVRCELRGRLTGSDTEESKPLAVGDRVAFERMGENEGVIVEIKPRTTKLSRAHPHDPKKEKIIVANVSQLLIVSSVRRPPLNLGIIDRYVIAAEIGGLQPVICINKCDLASAESEYRDVVDMFRSSDRQLIVTSALTGRGIEDLKAVLQGESTVLAGHSGVGKSSLINAIQPHLNLKTGEVKRKGRHTTSNISLLRLDFGGYVVDTPGIREFTMWDLERRHVMEFFPRIWELGRDCRMPDCLHLQEPACAVKLAVEQGQLPSLRYESYRRIAESIQESSVPRRSTVERRWEQISTDKREPSRRKKKQDLQRRLQQGLENHQ